MAKESIIQLVAAKPMELLRAAAPQSSADFVIPPGAGPSKKGHNYFVVSYPVGCLGTPMGKIGQIAVGALAAICITGASIGMDAGLNPHQSAFAANQLERLYVDAKIDRVGAKIVDGVQSVVHALLGIAD